MSDLRVMTWNVENLFLPNDPGGTDNESVFERKLAALAAVIDQEAPHILALQEIGSDGALTTLLERLTHAMPHKAVGDPDHRGIRVAVLSVHTLGSVAKHREFPAALVPIQVRDIAPNGASTPVDEA